MELDQFTADPWWVFTYIFNDYPLLEKKIDNITICNDIDDLMGILNGDHYTAYKVMYTGDDEINYIPSSDTTVDPQKDYYEYDSVRQKYVEVITPTGDPSAKGYYEIEYAYYHNCVYQLNRIDNYVETSDATVQLGKRYYYKYTFQDGTEHYIYVDKKIGESISPQDPYDRDILYERSSDEVYWGLVSEISTVPQSAEDTVGGLTSYFDTSTYTLYLRNDGKDARR